MAAGRPIACPPSSGVHIAAFGSGLKSRSRRIGQCQTIWKRGTAGAGNKTRESVKKI